VNELKHISDFPVYTVCIMLHLLPLEKAHNRMYSHVSQKMKSELRCFWGTQSLQTALLAQFRLVKAPPVASACPHMRLWARIVDIFSSISSAVALNTALLQSFMTVIFWSKRKGLFVFIFHNSVAILPCSCTAATGKTKIVNVTQLELRETPR